MQYFVSIENTRYMRWQLRLLHESMKRLGIEKDLLVGVCDNPHESAEKIDFCRTFKHENIGWNLNYSPVNKPFALMNAVDEGLLKQPFVVIDPDMVFLKPVPQEDAQIVSQYVWHMELEFLESVGYLKGIPLPREKWQPIGCVYQFNKVEHDFFEDIYYSCIDLAALYKPGDGKLKVEQAYWVKEMLAFALPISLYIKNVKVVNHFQTPLDVRLPAGRTDAKDACLVHYCGSYKPYFDKHEFHPEHKNYIAERSPFATIMQIPSQNTRVRAVQNIAYEIQG